MFYESKYGDIYYEFTGRKGAPVVVLCHGVGMDHKTFAKQVSALEKHDTRFSLIAAECLVD